MNLSFSIMRKIIKVFIWSGIAAAVIFISLTIQPITTESDDQLTIRNAEALAKVEPVAECGLDCTTLIWSMCRRCPENGGECFYSEGSISVNPDRVCYN